jgi:hypothetical protein
VLTNFEDCQRGGCLEGGGTVQQFNDRLWGAHQSGSDSAFCQQKQCAFESFRT